jgi:hypothetical protein
MINGIFASSPTIHLSVDLFDHFLDVLRWIPCKSGSFERIPFEPPMIDRRGAAIGARVFERLQALYSCGTKTLTLRGPLMSSDATGNAWRRTQLRLKRDELLEVLGGLVVMFRWAAEKGCYIYVSDRPESYG